VSTTLTGSAQHLARTAPIVRTGITGHSRTQEKTMLAHLSRHRSDPRTVARQARARLRRVTAVLAAVTCGLLAWATAVPAALATPRPLPPPGGQYGPAPVVPVTPTIVRVVMTGGMAGWQIALIAVGAALAAAAAVLLIDRARAARRATPAPTAGPRSDSLAAH
jgi:hypothetical protein